MRFVSYFRIFCITGAIAGLFVPSNAQAKLDKMKPAHFDANSIAEYFIISEKQFVAEEDTGYEVDVLIVPYSKGYKVNKEKYVVNCTIDEYTVSHEGTTWAIPVVPTGNDDMDKMIARLWDASCVQKLNVLPGVKVYSEE